MATETRTRKRTTLDRYGRVLIPAEIRDALGLKPGDRLIARVIDGELRLMTIREGIRRAQAIVRRHTAGQPSLVDELIAERRREAERE
jgi:AbrB family looped-hinge helix DNA binding protein